MNLVFDVSLVKISRLPPTGRPLSVTAPTPSHHRQLAAGRQYRFRLPTSVLSVGEMDSGKLVFAPTELTILFL
jgi:hypothetical protein